MQRRWPEVYQRSAVGARAVSGQRAPIAEGPRAARIIASFIKFSGTKLREFLIENKLRRDSLIWISILRIKCGFMFSFRCFFSLCYAKQCSTLFRYYNTLYFWVKDSFEVKLSCINYFIFDGIVLNSQSFETLMVIPIFHCGISFYCVKGWPTKLCGWNPESS